MRVELKYPVFAFKKNDNLVYVFFTERDLKSTSIQILESLNYENVTHIDSLGNKYKINKSYKVKYLGLWGFNPLLKGRQILIDFEYEPKVEQVLLSDLKKNIIDRVEKTKRIWKSGWEIDELKKAILNSSSFEEIANLIK